MKNAFVQICAMSQIALDFIAEFLITHSLVRKRSRVRFPSWAPCISPINTADYPLCIESLTRINRVPKSPDSSPLVIRVFVQNLCKKNHTADAGLLGTWPRVIGPSLIISNEVFHENFNLNAKIRTTGPLARGRVSHHGRGKGDGENSLH
jgi:hypothetical protein